MKVACLQSIVPHYRVDFFKEIHQHHDINVYIYKEEIGNTFDKGDYPIREIKTHRIGCLLMFQFKKLIDDGNEVVIFPFQAKTVLPCLHLLVLSKLYHFKVILWGHGISIQRYLKEEKRPNPLLKLQLRFADGCWVYMDKEAEQWKKIFPDKPIVALHNTISGAEEIMKRQVTDKERLKTKYGIKEKRVVIYCARCTAQRRFDLLVSVIEQLKSEPIGFIIIGAGEAKPDFKGFEHVYDFGAVYDTAVKNDLFDIADIYFQPGWVGLSIVEAMLYGKPILTFKRTKDILQCVEYSYIEENVNGHIVENVNDACKWLKSTTEKEIAELSDMTKSFANKNLKMSCMAANACSIIDKLR